MLVTGANGFVGRVLCELAVSRGYEVLAGVRRSSPSCRGPNLRGIAVGDIDGTTDWRSALDGVSTVIHAAGRAHVMHERAADPLLEFRRTNTEGTRHLAESAARHGVRRMVFVSSVKVNGERTPPLSSGFRETDQPSPRDPYGISKYEAELALYGVAARTGLEIAIVRPPLVFGSGVRANFLSLMRLVDRGLPLPLAAIRNRRSIVSVWNLADLLLLCARHERAAGQVFFASDERAVSTPELVRLLAGALQRRARLVWLPTIALKAAGAALRSSAEVRRLCDSLQVDNSHARRALNWTPMLSLEEGISRTAAWYRATTRSGAEAGW